MFFISLYYCTVIVLTNDDDYEYDHLLLPKRDILLALTA